jgi:hypothetical protein
MKNSIYIDIDTSKEPHIVFSKPPDFVIPTTNDEAAEMLVSDVIGLSAALKALIIMGSKNNYFKNSEIIDSVIKTINEAII